MRYAMPNPELINGNYYLRLHVPKDVAEKARGTTVAIPVGDAIKYQKVGSVVKVSLLTKVAAEAKHRFTKALAAVEAHWESLRREPVKLTHKQCVGLAGELYSDFIRVSDENPGPPDLWQQIRKMDEEAKTARLRPIEALMIPRPEPSAEWSLEERFGGFADVMLQRHSLQVDAASRRQLVLQIAKAMDKATAVILRKAEGDYSDSGETNAFPQFVPPSPADSEAAPTSKTEPKTARVSITQLFGLWELPPIGFPLMEAVSSSRSATPKHRHEDVGGNNEAVRVEWMSYQLSDRLTAGRLHGSAVAIIIGLILAWIGGMMTGGSRGLADVPLFTGIGLMGGAMLRDLAIVSTAYGVDMREIRKAGAAGVSALALGIVVSFAVGAAIAAAFGYTDAVSMATIGGGAATYIVGPVTGT